VVAALLALAVLLVVAEGTLRIHSASELRSEVERARYRELLQVTSPDPAIGHVHRPGSSARLMGVDVRINADGLRDGEHRRVRDARRRLLFLGDSITFGWGVDQDVIFAALLERALDAHAPTEVVNFGIGDYNTSQEVALFLDDGLAYEPDEVVVFYAVDDAEPTRRVTQSPRGWASDDLHLVRLLTQAAPAPLPDDARARLYHDDQPGWLETRRALLRLAEACRANGIALKVVLLPELRRLDPYPFAREHALVIDFLRENGIEVADLTARFADVGDPRALWIAGDDPHPNAAAHRRIAEAALPFLSDGAVRQLR
jgi:lysophospholipase L1-like esterase